MVKAFIQQNRWIVFFCLTVTLCLAPAFSHFAYAQAIDPTAGTSKAAQPAHAAKPKAPAAAQPAVPTVDPRFNQHAHGYFDIKITPLALYDKAAPAKLGRRYVERQIHGDFEGISKGEMLTAKTDVEGSEAYVAIEYVAGALKGHKGTFMLQHKGIMIKGKLNLVLSVIPDSGTGDLAGLDGLLNIDVAGGKHFYDFTYMLPSLKK